MLIKAWDFIFPANFLVLDIEENQNMPVILERPFLAGWDLLDFEMCEMILMVEDKQ